MTRTRTHNHGARLRLPVDVRAECATTQGWRVVANSRAATQPILTRDRALPPFRPLVPPAVHCNGKASIEKLVDRAQMTICVDTGELDDTSRHMDTYHRKYGDTNKRTQTYSRSKKTHVFGTTVIQGRTYVFMLASRF